MTIGVIGAMQMEVDDLKAQMTDTQTEVYSGVEFVEGKIGDQYVVAANPDDCIGCASCGVVCPDAAIEVYREV